MDPRACGGGHCFKVFPKVFPGHLINRIVVPIFCSAKQKPTKPVITYHGSFFYQRNETRFLMEDYTVKFV